MVIGLIFTLTSSIQSQSISSLTEIKADKLFGRKAYQKAAKLYLALSAENTDKQVVLKLARSYFELKEPAISYFFYKQVIDRRYLVHSSDYLKYAQVLKVVQRPEEAKLWVNRYLTNHPRDEKAQNLLYELLSSNRASHDYLEIPEQRLEPSRLEATLLVVNSVNSSKSYVITKERVIEVMRQSANPQQDWLKTLMQENHINISNTISLDPILYRMNQVEIDKSYQRELDKLAKLMTQYDFIDFEIRVHTDASGSEAYNQQLSQSRANAARDFLLTREIQIERLLAIGYGEHDPIYDCLDLPCNNKEIQLNRRMEFRLVHLKHHQIVSN